MNSSFNKYDRHMQVAREAAREAGKTVLSKQKDISITEKATNNLVTEADLAAQEKIIGIIREHFPEHGIIAEEDDLRDRSDISNLWIIDPLDGTNNFAHTIPHFCISIAYASNGLVMAGIVYDPLRDEFFSALRGQGAFLNEAPIKVSETYSLKESIVATGFYYERGSIMRKTLNSIEKLFNAGIHGIRRYGSAALDLCWVACGRFDAYFEYKISTWDFAAGMLIVEESGGKCSDHRGGKLGLNSAGIAVSNGIVHEEFLSIVGWDDSLTDGPD